MKIRQTIVLGVIGSLFFIGTVIASPASAESPATMLPAEAVTAITQDSQITFEVIKEKHDVVEIDITYPVISGLTDADFQEQLNYFIKKQVIYSKDLIEMQADEFVQEAKKNGWEMRPYVLSIDYDLKSNDEAFLSFTMTYYTFTGGANGMTVVNCFNIDKKANKPLQLAALFPPGADYKAVMNREIAKQIELRSQDDNVMFFEGDMGFKGISDTQGFYLKDNDIVIVFPKYEIAPGAMGIPEFAVNRADLKKSVAAQDGEIVIAGLVFKTVLNAENQTVMIPLRQVGEHLGYTVDWNAAQRSVMLTKGQATAKLKIDDNIYIANHKIPYILEAVPIIMNDRTFVPVSFLEQVLLYQL